MARVPTDTVMVYSHHALVWGTQLPVELWSRAATSTGLPGTNLAIAQILACDWTRARESWSVIGW